ncbi:MAG: hypothetical protein Q4G68_04555 [Planctomycetia bacterium]|nr:hypothetical protein [Planctomycetia bacterium]
MKRLQKTGFYRTAPICALALAALVLTACLTGCGSQPYKVVPVEGTLTSAGQPLANCVIQFKPAEGRLSSAKTDENGHFKAQYSSDTAGIQVGECRLYLVNVGGTITGPGKFTYTPEQQKLLEKYGTSTEGFPVTITKKDKNMVIDLP